MEFSVDDFSSYDSGLDCVTPALNPMAIFCELARLRVKALDVIPGRD